MNVNAVVRSEVHPHLGTVVFFAVLVVIHRDGMKESIYGWGEHSRAA